MQLNSGLSGRKRCLLRLDYYLSAISDSHALGGHVGMLGQGHVDRTPLVGRHRLQGYGASGRADSLGDSMREIGQRLVAPLLVAFDVYEQVRPFVELAGGDEPHEELESAEGLAAAANQEAGVVAFYVEHGAAQIFVVGLLKSDYGLHAHLRYQILKYLGGDVHDVGGLFEQGHADLCGLGADAQYAGLAPANDVYFYLTSIGV